MCLHLHVHVYVYKLTQYIIPKILVFFKVHFSLAKIDTHKLL